MKPMKIQNNTILNLVKNRGSLLVFLYTGAHMMACIAKKNQHTVELSKVVQSQHIDTILAVADIKEQMLLKNYLSFRSQYDQMI